MTRQENNLLMKKLDILYEDEYILVCVKPSGVPVQSRSAATPDMESLLKNHLTPAVCSGASGTSRISKKGAPYLAVIHRLDQPVKGILVFAKTPETAANLNRQLQENKFGKFYQAVICGVLPSDRGTLTDYLVKDGRTNTSRICSQDTPGAKFAELSYSVLNTFPKTGLSVVKIHLKTGRHHQIRVQMAGAGAPLWGDTKYNPEFTQKKGYTPIALCAFRLQFCHPATGKNMEFEIACDWSQTE